MLILQFNQEWGEIFEKEVLNNNGTFAMLNFTTK